MRLFVVAAALAVAFVMPNGLEDDIPQGAAAYDYDGEHGPTTVFAVDFCNATWWEVTGAPVTASNTLTLQTGTATCTISVRLDASGL